MPDTIDQPIQVIDAPLKVVRYGPWKGTMRSIPSDRVPPEFMAESDSDAPSANYQYDPRRGSFMRRLGQSQKFDTFGSAVGQLPAKWSARCRQLSEFSDPGISDHVPTMCALLTKETLSDTTLVDDGRFSNFWVRDQVNGVNYTAGSEYSSTTYPAPGSTQTFRYVPLWHDSGDGGMVRGTTEFERRFYFGGSRQFAKVGNWTYHPSFFGTPSRYLPSSVQSGTTDYVATSDVSGFASSAAPFKWVYKNSSSGTEAIATTDSTKYLEVNNASAALFTMTGIVNTSTLPSTTTSWIVTARIKLSHEFEGVPVIPYAGAATWQVIFADNAGNKYTCNATNIAGTANESLNGDWTTVTFSTMAGTITAGGSGTANTMVLNCASAADFSPTFRIDSVIISGVTGSSTSSRLIPSGPFPACHAGTLAHGTATGGTSESIRPDGTTAAGSWTNSTGGAATFATIDEATTDDTDYIHTTTNNDTCTFTLSDPSLSPSSSDTVTVNFRARAGNSFLGSITCELLETATSKASLTHTLSVGFAAYSFTLTPTQISSVSNWANARIKFTAGASVTTMDVSQAYVTIATGSSAGGWTGSDRFFYGVVPIFEDDSFWMPTIPRFPNNLLSTGFNLFTVDSANPTTTYDKVTWSNLPVLWYGNKQKALVRSNKIDSSTTDNLALNPFGMRIVAIVDNSVTTYDDYFADDDSLQLDPGGLLVHYDHIMPPRARYVFGGDMRVCHSYGATNPCAIVICPVGRTADYDLNLVDTDSTLYNADASYMRVTIDTAGTSKLELSQADGANPGTVSVTTSFDFATYNTLEKLVDAINATSCADNSQQWRAQLCPGVDPNAIPTTHLAAHKRVIASVTTTNNSTDISGTGLGKVAIGSRVSGAGITAGTYVTKILTDTSTTDTLRLSAVATASASVTLTFYQEFGDAPTAATANNGWQRVISQSLPGFLYFNRTYLDQFTTEKSSIWMTTSSPGATKSAPNCFSGKISNKFFPPNAKAGKAMGGVGIRQGFRVLFENARGIIDNTAHQGSGIDEEYRLKITHDTSGCISWASVAAGTNFAVYAAPEGILAGDLRNEVLLSSDIWSPPNSDAPTGTGDFSYEIPTSIAATAADNDNAMLYCSIIRGQLRVNYRTSASTTHPNRQVVYDFSTGTDSAGIEALFRGPKQLWGWSTPFSGSSTTTGRAITCMGEGRRSDGAHIYGWNDLNAGSTGDGRIDEIDTGQTDNGTAISASITTPWYRPGSSKLSFHRFVCEHATPSGATVAFDFHRSIADETYSLTPSTSSALYIRDWKELTLPARAPTSAGYFGFRQSAGTQQEIRSLEVYVEPLDTYA